ncbi:alpha amylase catalytic region [Spirochaeta thermophila DSM 6578]|uniref:Alpha amylase catalytic region n=1 Tax=Winmispira thermophila (strain ATCC 700085 / DSM 6578 / Z-1203) TaxID=869211 RepID=G0GAN4_WINT7|nr:alpha-glucosidase [Spirochaeta thermophila]AEJ60999.1 alpha amylase catalytic region [Spirochaeta thermophila DSM 6578]
MSRQWWKEAIVYQIYPRSFMDSNGDGIGDLRGIIQRIDYLVSLGVDAVWLNPVYRSPNVDNGYDISDFFSIMEEFGSMEDWEELLSALHARGIRLVMDLVLNHTSDQHPWFIASRSSRDDPYRHYYIWRDRPNNWRSLFEGPAWEYDEATGEYYLHVFAREQPDLNWAYPPLREELYRMVNWWLDKGIDGFRLDAISVISKHPDFPDGEEVGPDGLAPGTPYFMNGPHLGEYLEELYRRCFHGRDVLTVGECAGVHPDDLPHLVGDDKALKSIFFMDHMFLDLGPDGYRFGNPYPYPWRWSQFKRIVHTWYRAFSRAGWMSFYLGNHDFPRCISRFGCDGEYWLPSGKLLATLLLTMPGTIYLYQGDEIGMTNAHFTSIESYRDVETLNYYRRAMEEGRDTGEVMAEIMARSRDNARTPMQWSSAPHAGFTTGEPWIPLNPNYRTINVARQESDRDSLLSYYRRLIRMRKEHADVLVYGDLLMRDLDSDHLWVYDRTAGHGGFRIVLNLTPEEQEWEEGDAALVLSSLGDAETGRLRPYEARIYRI